MNKTELAALDNLISQNYGNTLGVAVMKDGLPVYQRHFGVSRPDRPAHIYSVTKSVVSALIGIAIDEGLIGGTDMRVLDFFPDYTPKRGEKMLQRITLRDIMTMTAPYKYKSAPYARYFSSESWVSTALDLLGGKEEPGRFRYAPLIGPDILTGALSRACGRSVREYAEEKLFSPLGISVPRDIVFSSKEEQLAIMTGGGEHHGWVADPQGVNTAGWGLFLTADDLARLGQLYLGGGEYLGRRLISADWIDESTREHSRWDEQGLSYGYLWWVLGDGCFAAMGDGGNIIYVNRAKRLTVALTASFKPRAADRIALVREHIEPIFG